MAGRLLESSAVAATKPRYVDVSNPALAIDCPRCGLRTARFMQYCRNCGFSLWPSSRVASAAFQAWRAQEADRAAASRFDLRVPVYEGPEVVDFEERAHHLGIHLFPASAFPFPIAIGTMILFFGLVPFPGEPAWVRIGIFVLGVVVLLYGVVGWVVLEDTRMYPGDAVEVGEPEAHGSDAHVEVSH